MASKKKAEKQVNDAIEWEKKLSGIQTRYRELDRKYKKLLKEGDAADKLVDYARGAIDSLPAVPVPCKPRSSKKLTHESLVVVGSDWHVGEIVSAEETGGLNSYDIETFAKRLQVMIDKTISFTKRNLGGSHRFSECHFFMLGDMLCGDIHEELTNTAHHHIVDQMLMASVITAQALIDLAREFPKVVVTGISGN